MARTSAERIKAYRQRKREAGEPDTSRTFKKDHKRLYKRLAQFKQKPFIGCDGEGCGTDELGRQLYMLFRIGDRELFTGQPLRTYDLLDFICDAPANSILVGFAFGYDVTMILRDFSERQLKRLFQPRGFGKGHSPYVWFHEFDVEYLPRNYLRVRRVELVQDPETGDRRRVPVPGSCRTIFETFGFFQKSFLKTIESFDVGSIETRNLIAVNKAKRSGFTEMSPEVRHYCALECQYLADLMERLREYCNAAGIKPSMWAGAGKLAAALHKLHNTPRKEAIELNVPKKVRDMANMAFYGGRFEITRTGHIQQKVYEYDIRSAYPDAMLYLPCLVHGTWKRFTGSNVDLGHDLFVGNIKFRHVWPRSCFRGLGALGGFPIRSKEGHIYWPSTGSGIYWSPEIIAAIKLGAKVKINGGYKFVPGCSCTPFEWVRDLYNYRREIGSQGPGYPIKLGSNSLYGKLVQRIGSATFHNDIWGGLITAYTRAKLMEAVALAPGKIIMLATDALYSLVPLPELDCSDELGNWESAELNGLFIVQPGLYWCPEKRKKKSRGLPGKFFETNNLTNKFERAWYDFEALDKAGAETKFPVVPVPVPGFIGLKLALSRNKPETAGRWINDTRDICFDYRNKRQGHKWDGSTAITRIKPGHSDLVSLPYRDFLKGDGAEAWDEARLMLEEQPDFVDLSPPFMD